MLICNSYFHFYVNILKILREIPNPEGNSFKILCRKTVKIFRLVALLEFTSHPFKLENL